MSRFLSFLSNVESRNSHRANANGVPYSRFMGLGSLSLDPAKHWDGVIIVSVDATTYDPTLLLRRTESQKLHRQRLGKHDQMWAKASHLPGATL